MSDTTVNSDTDAFLVASMTAPQQDAIRTRIGLGTAATTASTDYAASSHTHIGTAIDYAGTTDIGAGLADADEFLVSDGGGNTTRVKSAVSRLWTFIKAKIDAGNTFAGNQTFSGNTTFGGTMTAKGNAGEVQYNSAGVLAGAANVKIESGNLKLMTAEDPATPSGGLVLYAHSMAGRLSTKMISPSGIDTALQVGLHGNSVILISPASGTTAPSIVGGTLTTAATMSFQYTAGSSNKWFSTTRKRFQTSTTAGTATGMRLAYTHCHIGNAAGFGGFFFRAQYGAQINLNGGQKFVGLCASTGALAGDPSALVNMCGVGYDAGDASTGNWYFMRNDGSGTATKVDLGADAVRGTTQGWDLIMFMAPNGTDLFVEITNLNTGVVVLNTSYNTDLPAVNTGLCFKAEVRNGAVAAADNLEVAKVYIETDY